MHIIPIDKKASLDKFQVLLHELFGTFLSFSSISPLSLFRRPKSIKYNVNSKIKYGERLLNVMGCNDRSVLNCWTVSKKSSCITSEKLAEIIACGYQYLEFSFQECKQNSISEIPRSQVSKREWDKWRLADKRLCHLNEFCNLIDSQGDCFGVYAAWIHGSLATRDFVYGYSDFDALIMVDKATCKNANKLLELQMFISKVSVFLYLHDPLQHHGVFVLSEIDCLSYPEAFFPLELFSYSAEIFSNTETQYVAIRDDFIERKNAFISSTSTIKGLLNNHAKLQYAYDLKALLQTVVLLPVFYLQIKNSRYYYKRNAIYTARADFTDKEWSIIDDVTSLRNHWVYQTALPNNVLQQVGMRFNPKLLSTIHRVISRVNKNDVIRIVGDDYPEKCLVLVEAMESKLKSVL